MALTNFNTLILTLSSTPPVANTNAMFVLSAAIQGITQVQLNYNLLSAFSSKMYKTTLNWTSSATAAVNASYDNSTLLPFNSAYTSYVYSPSTSGITTKQAAFSVYFENGAIHTFRVGLFILGDSLIDLDLNVLNVQNIAQLGYSVLNVQSNKQNVVFNVSDLR
jgi:hypothetical protein